MEITEDLLREFSRDVAGSSHVAGVRATAREIGCAPASPSRDSASPSRSSWSQQQSLDASLAACSQAEDWAGLYRGRRDAWLLVLICGLRLNRRDAVSLTRADLGVGCWSVLGRQLPKGEQPTTCWRCVAARWLECRELEDAWSRSAVRERLLSQRTKGDARSHDCEALYPTGLPGGSGLRGGTRRLYDDSALTVAIDRHGWISTDHRRALSPRSATSVLALRRRSTTVRSTATQPAANPTGTAGHLEDHVEGQAPPAAFDDTTFERLDATCQEADAVNARIEALLSQFGG